MRRFAAAAVVMAAVTLLALSSPASAAGITLSASGIVKDAQGHTFNYWLYTNPAYPCGKSIASMVSITDKDPCAVHSPTLDDTPPATSVYHWILALTQ